MYMPQNLILSFHGHASQPAEPACCCSQHVCLHRYMLAERWAVFRLNAAERRTQLNAERS